MLAANPIEIKVRGVELEQPCLSAATAIYYLEQNYLFKWIGFLILGAVGTTGWTMDSNCAQSELGEKLYLVVFLRKP